MFDNMLECISPLASLSAHYVMDQFLSQKLANGQVDVCSLKCIGSSWQALTCVLLSEHCFLSHYLLLWYSESDTLNMKATVSRTHSSQRSFCPYVHTIFLKILFTYS